MIPGEVITQTGDLELSAGRTRVTLRVDNSGDRPIQVGSHTHFFEVNSALTFERDKTYGFHLDVPAGTALRFEPGEGREVTLVAFAGAGKMYGMNQLVMGDLEEEKDAAFMRASEAGYR